MRAAAAASASVKRDADVGQVGEVVGDDEAHAAHVGGQVVDVGDAARRSGGVGLEHGPIKAEVVGLRVALVPSPRAA